MKNIYLAYCYNPIGIAAINSQFIVDGRVVKKSARGSYKLTCPIYETDIKLSIGRVV